MQNFTPPGDWGILLHYIRENWLVLPETRSSIDAVGKARNGCLEAD
ncbi:hypothetical protein BJP35_2286 [Enterobacter sp. J49]|nr:hypothetical protein BJP35_2286 [Enterobacter sp. J49]